MLVKGSEFLFHSQNQILVSVYSRTRDCAIHAFLSARFTHFCLKSRIKFFSMRKDSRTCIYLLEPVPTKISIYLGFGGLPPIDRYSFEPKMQRSKINYHQTCICNENLYESEAITLSSVLPSQSEAILNESVFCLRK